MREAPKNTWLGVFKSVLHKKKTDLTLYGVAYGMAALGVLGFGGNETSRYIFGLKIFLFIVPLLISLELLALMKKEREKIAEVNKSENEDDLRNG